MKPKTLTNQSGKTLAVERDVSPQQHQISDRAGKLLARYDSVTDQTFDRSGRFVGRGDLRAKFIQDE
jgi:hypothetical protein